MALGGIREILKGTQGVGGWGLLVRGRAPMDTKKNSTAQGVLPRASTKALIQGMYLEPKSESLYDIRRIHRIRRRGGVYLWHLYFRGFHTFKRCSPAFCKCSTSDYVYARP